jgi:hypothetical protein
MTQIKFVLKLLVSCCVYALIVLLIDFVSILLLRVEQANFVSILSLLMLLEGGLGLIIGSAVALYSPVISKVEEVIFHSEPWDAKRQKQAEKQGYSWIVTGGILVLLALLVSAI